VPADWPTYTSQALGFSIQHPGTYAVQTRPAGPAEPVAVDAPAPGVPVDPETYRRMKEEARGGTFSFEDRNQPGSVAAVIEVFMKEPDVSLRQWLELTGSIAADATTEPARLAGAGEGLRVRGGSGDDTWYFAQPRFVYSLTISNPVGEQMLSSFRLTAAD
jgi:hypothetical protein